MEGRHRDISGDAFGIRGNASNIKGNFDDCEITDEDRKRGIDISESVK